MKRSSLLSNFHGGLILPDTLRDTMAIDIPALLVAPLPAQVFIPLQQPYSTHVARVKPGDRVLKGEILDHIPPYNAASLQNPLPLLSSTSGTVTAIRKKAGCHSRVTSSQCIVIDVDGLEEWHPDAIMPDSWDSLDKKTQLYWLWRSAICGHGGGGFPLLQKVQTQNKISTLIINAVECEPQISCDAALLQNQSDTAVAGALQLQAICNANKVIIAVEENNSIIAQRLQHSIATHASSLAHSHESMRLELLQVPNVYPSGAERQLVEILTGLKIRAPDKPSAHGILCSNIATVYALNELAQSRRPPLRRIVTVTGSAIKNAYNIDALLGTRVKDLIETTGGYLAGHNDDETELTLGGAMCGVPLTDDSAPVSASTNCILANRTQASGKQVACIRCGDCSTVCPAELLPQQLYRYASCDNLPDATRFGIDACIECGCCDQVCPSQIPLTSVFRSTRIALHKNRDEKALAAKAAQRFENREKRLAKKQRERAERIEQRKKSISKQGKRPDSKAIAEALARSRRRRTNTQILPPTDEASE